ncbi:MAG: hypothetical protein WCJ70_04295, partial [bacterium]
GQVVYLLTESLRWIMECVYWRYGGSKRWSTECDPRYGKLQNTTISSQGTPANKLPFDLWMLSFVALPKHVVSGMLVTAAP